MVAIVPKALGRNRRRRGMTFIELAVGIAVLIVGVLGFAQTLVSIERTHLKTRQDSRATQAARAVLEAIESVPFNEAFRRYNLLATDDPGGTGTAPGGGFAVEGLTAPPGDADGLPGEVIFPTPNASPGQLREDVVLPELGMPRDLDGDGVIENTSVAGAYWVLPVIVRVRWVGPAGPGEVTLRTMLGDY
jgi:type II secretory pathway pseudopilin PulG